MKVFKDLTREEIKEFRQWAKDHYEPLTPIKGIWHPVVQAECVRINRRFNQDNGINIDKLIDEVLDGDSLIKELEKTGLFRRKTSL